MIQLNTQQSNKTKPSFGGIASNTRLIPPNTTPITTNKSLQHTDNNSFQSLDSTEKSPIIFHNHLDWLTLNFEKLPKHKFDELINLTGRGLIVSEEARPWTSGEKAKTYENTISSAIGLKGAYNSCKSENGIDSHYDLTISLSGQYFSSLNTIEQWSLCKNLQSKYDARCSRVDVSIDDESFSHIPINEMIQAYRNGNYFDFKEYHHETDEKDPNNPNTVHYFGGKGSKKLVRVYNHKDKSLRLETQFRGKYAQVAFEAIATLKRDDKTEEEWTKIIQKNIGGIALSTVDFRDKSKLKNRSKACKSKTKRFAWWQDFIDQIGTIHLIKIETIKPDMTTYQKRFNWLEKMASKTLAIIFNVIGNERFINYIFRLVSVGESKFTPQDRKTIEYLKDNLDYIDFTN